MPKRDPNLLLQDMLEAARKIEFYIARLEHSAFLLDGKTIDAVVRNLEDAQRFYLATLHGSVE